MPRCAFLLVLCALAGCSNSNPSAAVGPPTNAPLPPTPLPDPTPSLVYTAYGDSITYGYNLADPTTQAYPYLVAKEKGYSLLNLGVPGAQTCDMMPLYVLPAHASIPTSPILTTILTGTNDIDSDAAGVRGQIFNTCQQATVSWLGLLDSYKVRGNSDRVRSTGATHVETDHGWSAIYTDAPGASVTFPIQHEAEGTVYVWYRLFNDSPGTFSYTLDSSVLGVQKNSFGVPVGRHTGDSVGLLRIESVPSGSHTVTFTQTSSTGSAVGILAVAAPPQGKTSSLPLVLVGTIPKQQFFTGGGTCAFSVESDAACLAYTENIKENVRELTADGLNVSLFDTRKYVTGTSFDMIDSLHPNALGQQEIAHAVIDQIK